MCDGDLSGAPAVVFLGGEICAPCSAEMAAELEAGTPSPSTQPSLLSGSALDHSSASGDARAGGSARVSSAPSSPPAGAAPALLTPGAPATEDAALFTPGTGTVTCAGCERPMPGPGSYRVLRGKPYCAACLPFYARLPPAADEQPAAAPMLSAPASSAATAASSSIPASSSPLARPGQCDCCRRVLDDAAQQREGFELCSACLTSDAELALSVARARHRRARARLRSRLEGAE